LSTTAWARARPLLTTLLAGGTHVAAVIPLARTLELSAIGSFLALAGYFVYLGFVANMVEAVVFTRGPSPIRGLHWLGGIAGGIGLAGITAFVLQPDGDVDLRAAYAE